MRTLVSSKYEYINSMIIESTPQLSARKASQELGKERISLSPTEGAILRFLAFGLKAEKIVEIGTLTGLSALYLSEALSSTSQIWTLEKDAVHCKKASEVLQSSENFERIHVVEGDARETLLKIESHGPFDFVFIDANKAGYGDYLSWAQKNIKSGGLIAADNVFLGGSVWGADSEILFSKKQIEVMTKFNQQLMQSAEFISCIVPTEEGLLLACKK